MKKYLPWTPWIVTAVFAAWMLGGAMPRKEKSEYHLAEFGKLPVLLNGRVQPLDSVARNALLILRARQSLYLGDETKGAFQKAETMPANEWLLEVMTRPEEADAQKVFRIDSLELRGELKLDEKRKYYSFNDLKEPWDTVQRQAERISKVEPEVRTPVEKQIVKLSSALSLYFRLKNSLKPENSPDFLEELKLYEETVKPGLLAVQQSQAGEKYNEDDLALMAKFFDRYKRLSQVAYPLMVPPANPDKNRLDWLTVGGSLMQALRSTPVHPAVIYYARMGSAYANKSPDGFNRALAEYQAWLAPSFTREMGKGMRESFFNQFEPFYKCMVVYIAALLLGCFYWFNWIPWPRVTAFRLVTLAWVVHTAGLIFRMVLEGRPPVTNLYSSAIFIGWGAVGLGLILERIYKDGIGVVTASCIGFTTLVIAHNLSLDGDTMEMLRAVLDTNFWLATHVVVVTLGYASTFISGFLGIVYLVRGVLTRSLPTESAKSLNRMIYGIVCFATLFSFVGTVLGGIWADQSWGRFWGWDPKENGALLIVIWNAAILHARWGGIVRERGLAAMAVFGNIVTSFSWFGVNMLGVGLHSYGFMDHAFKWLLAFDISQVLVLALAFIPPRYWRSFKNPLPPTRGPKAGTREPATASA